MAYVPVETLLKVDDSELLIEENNKIKQLTTVPINSVSIGTQCDWKIEQSGSKANILLSDSTKSELPIVTCEAQMISDKNSNGTPGVIRNWPIHSDSEILCDQKLLIPAVFSQQFTCSLPSIPGDEKIMLQFDYKTRNKLKTKQRRLDPFYRSQERVRQRTMMRLKRQDPGFRAAEREKGRCRMRLKRLDPEFRCQERERQRERMKAKRSDPEFREREREQQKTRLHVKRLDPAFKEKEREQDRLRMCMKRQNNSLYANLHSNNIRVCHANENVGIVSDKMLKDISKSSDDSGDVEKQQSVFPENFNSKLLSLKPREIETFHFKKQHILNFNFYNTNKEQWSQELCSRTMAHFNDLSENNVFQTASMPDINIELLRRNPAVSRKVDLKIIDSAENLVNVKLNELPLLEVQKPKCSNDHNISMNNKFSTSLIPDVNPGM